MQMVKLIGEPIKVHQDRDSLVTAFIWRKRLYRVTEVIGWWREPSEWWDGKAMRLFYRVTAKHASTGTYELYRLGESWFLSRILD
ncbi:MAG TPA: nucleotidyltransferase [Dehalococcoidia bacterium]|nr:nucleotidyltransferase [Dehalococcoidia bacterium]